MKKLLFLGVALLVAGCCTQQRDESGWISLFNGKGLAGCTVRGKAS